MKMAVSKKLIISSVFLFFSNFFCLNNMQASTSVDAQAASGVELKKPQEALGEETSIQLIEDIDFLLPILKEDSLSTEEKKVAFRLQCQLSVKRAAILSDVKNKDFESAKKKAKIFFYLAGLQRMADAKLQILCAASRGYEKELHNLRFAALERLYVELEKNSNQLLNNNSLFIKQWHSFSTKWLSSFVTKCLKNSVVGLNANLKKLVEADICAFCQDLYQRYAQLVDEYRSSGSVDAVELEKLIIDLENEKAMLLQLDSVDGVWKKICKRVLGKGGKVEAVVLGLFILRLLEIKQNVEEGVALLKDF